MTEHRKMQENPEKTVKTLIRHRKHKDLREENNHDREE